MSEMTREQVEKACCRFIDDMQADLLRADVQAVASTDAALRARVAELELELEEYRSIAEKVGAGKAISERDAALARVAELERMLYAMAHTTSGSEGLRMGNVKEDGHE